MEEGLGGHTEESGFFSVGSEEPSQQGRYSHRWTPLSPRSVSLSTLETECSLVVGRAELTLKIKQAPGCPFCPRRRQIHHWGMAGMKLERKVHWEGHVDAGEARSRPQLYPRPTLALLWWVEAEPPAPQAG